MDDIILNKVAIIERCIARINEEYLGHENEITTNFTKQDAIILNLQRACETSIDLANHLIRINKLGIPQTTREAFSLIEQAGIIPADLSQNLQKMVGFRNIAVHAYQTINIDILRSIIKDHLSDFLHYGQILLQKNN